MSDTPYVVALCTVPSADEGARIAGHLVEDKHVACVNIIDGLRSIYVWQGEVCDDREALLVMKTRAELFEGLSKRVAELHPYDVPEVVALPITAGHAPYLQWIDEVVGR